MEHLFVCSTLAELLIFTNHGRMFFIKVYEIPESGRVAKGRALVNLLDMKEDEKLCAILPLRERKEDTFIFMGTCEGIVKKTAIEEFGRSKRNGIIACSLNEGDTLIGVALTHGNDDVMLTTKSGMAIRFSEDDVRPMGRGARGVNGIRLDKDDKVVGMAVVPKAAESEATSELTLLTVCESGYGKRTSISEYRAQSRGGKGVIDIQTDGRNGAVINSLVVTNQSGLMLVTSGGQTIRTRASDMSVIGRNTLGVRIINLSEGERVVDVAIAPTGEDDPVAEEPATPTPGQTEDKGE